MEDVARIMKVLWTDEARSQISELQDPKKREIILGHYRIMCCVENNTVFITRVRHDARLFDQ
jgi:mRNA-degrading endonuclease RelE of RelBE toxin-antitoxin system